ncbi:hypothetical protein EJV47_18235 [Hymenobacter gummosus]|uniref:Uncharacterized protein n=1 Tax=Hymenobacter gummosus TaxID=1776032 RepID=A0A3S0J8F1_9BACT|nr:hypothetical protein [Hymenobacter gummosus]RTQ47858.1 hypothetical protein EJV47_18235 [Hymenobacter gummosus]
MPRQDDGCVRGLPEPVLNKAVFPTATFQLNKARREGLETARLGGGTRLSLRNSGCEYYTLTFRFEGQLGTTPTDTRGWYRQAAALLRQTAPGLQASVHPLQAATALTRAAAARAAPALNQELYYGGNDVREYVTLDQARRVGSNGYFLELTVALGPL